MLGLHNNGSNTFLFVKSVSIQSKRFRKKTYPLCLGNIWKDFTINKMRKTGLMGYLNDFFVDHNIIDINDILDIHKYLIKIT